MSWSVGSSRGIQASYGFVLMEQHRNEPDSLAEECQVREGPEPPGQEQRTLARARALPPVLEQEAHGPRATMGHWLLVHFHSTLPRRMPAGTGRPRVRTLG